MVTKLGLFHVNQNILIPRFPVFLFSNRYPRLQTCSHDGLQWMVHSGQFTAVGSCLTAHGWMLMVDGIWRLRFYGFDFTAPCWQLWLNGSEWTAASQRLLVNHLECEKCVQFKNLDSLGNHSGTKTTLFTEIYTLLQGCKFWLLDAFFFNKSHRLTILCICSHNAKYFNRSCS